MSNNINLFYFGNEVYAPRRFGKTSLLKKLKQDLKTNNEYKIIYAKKFNKKVVVIFDEFQEIEQLEFEKKLRSVIQTHSREVSYIFSGSKKSILTQMFNDKSRAFYKSVKHFHINEILLDDWTTFYEILVGEFIMKKVFLYGDFNIFIVRDEILQELEL